MLTIIVVLIVAAVAVAAIAVVKQETRARLHDLRDHDRERRALAKESRDREDDLLNRLAHAYDKPWEQPPEPDVAPAEEYDELELAYDASHIEDDDLDLEPSGSF